MTETVGVRMPSLRRGVSATLTGNIAYVGSQFLMLAAVARLTTTTDVGRYALALAITGPIFMFTGLKLRQVQVTDVAGANRPGDFFALRAVTSLAAVAASLAVALVTRGPGATVALVGAVAAFKAAEAQLDVLYGALQRREHMYPVARNQYFRAAGGLAAFTGVLWISRSVWEAVVALTVLTAVAGVTCTMSIARLHIPIGLTFEVARLRALAVLALPLGVSMAIGSLLTNVPRYVIDHFEGTSTLGIFAAVSYVLVATNTVVLSVAEATTPRLANLFEARDQRSFTYVLVRLCVGGLLLGAVGILAAAVLGRWLLRSVYGDEYGVGASVLTILMVAAAVQYAAVFLGTAVNSARLFRVQVPINAITLAVVGVASLALVPRSGLIGAAWAIVLSQVALAIMTFFVYARKVRPVFTPQPASKTGET